MLIMLVVTDIGAANSPATTKPSEDDQELKFNFAIAKRLLAEQVIISPTREFRERRDNARSLGGGQLLRIRNQSNITAYREVFSDVSNAGRTIGTNDFNPLLVLLLIVFGWFCRCW